MKFAVAGLWHPHTFGAYRNFQKLLGDEAEMLGVWNVSPSQEENVKKNSFDKKRYASLEDLLRDKPDVVMTSHQNNRKADVIEAAAAAGIPVYADKPLCTDRAQLDRIKRAVARLPLGCQLELRYFPAMYHAGQRVRAGEIGEIVAMTFQGPHKLNPAARDKEFLDARISGGPLVDLCIHDVDLAIWLAGGDPRLIASVLAQRCAQDTRPGFFDAGMMMFSTGKGALTFIRAGWFTPRSIPKHGDIRAVIEGTRGTINVSFMGDPVDMQGAYKEYLHGHYEIFTMDRPAERVVCREAPLVEADFLKQLRGQPHETSKATILEATELTITAHERAQILVTENLPDPWTT